MGTPPMNHPMGNPTPQGPPVPQAPHKHVQFSPVRKSESRGCPPISPRLSHAHSANNIVIPNPHHQKPHMVPSASHIGPISPPMTSREREKMGAPPTDLRPRSRTISKENYRENRYHEKPRNHDPRIFDFPRKNSYPQNQLPPAPLMEIPPSDYNHIMPPMPQAGEDVGALKREIQALRKEKEVREKEFFKTNQEMKQIKDSLRANQDFLLALKKDMVTVQQTYPQQHGRNDEFDNGGRQHAQHPRGGYY